MTQKERILKSKSSIHEIGGTTYKGEHPVYKKVTNRETNLEEYVKVSKGVPFVKVDATQPEGVK
jgi:hypothetical protein